MRYAAVFIPEPRLALTLDQLQDTEFLLRDISKRDREPDIFRAQYSEAPADEATVRRFHRIFEQVFRTARPVADVDSLPVRSARGTAI